MPPKVEEPPALWVYRLATDAGSAPNVADGYLTLTICKPRIREFAKKGDFVLSVVAAGLMTKEQKKENKAVAAATGSEKAFRPRIAYLFRVDDIVTFENYMGWCSTHAASKICKAPYHFGDCQYTSTLEQIKGPHGPNWRNTNISGKHALVSQTYAAWTPKAPSFLTPANAASFGLDWDQVVGQGIGQFKQPLTAANVASILATITSGPHPYASEEMITFAGAKPGPVVSSGHAAAGNGSGPPPPKKEESPSASPSASAAAGDGSGSVAKKEEAGAAPQSCTKEPKKGGSRKHKQRKHKQTRKRYGRHHV
jgi:hypothetical protein